MVSTRVSTAPGLLSCVLATDLRFLPAEPQSSHAKTTSEASLRILPAALLALAVFGQSRVARATTYYVAPTGGSDTAAGAGTMTLPFATVGRAQTAAAAGDTVHHSRRNIRV